jgi:hypothetical protein
MIAVSWLKKRKKKKRKKKYRLETETRLKPPYPTTGSGGPDEIHAEFFGFGTSKHLGEAIALLEALNFDTCTLLAKKCPSPPHTRLSFLRARRFLETSVPVFFL